MMDVCIYQHVYYTYTHTEETYQKDTLYILKLLVSMWWDHRRLILRYSFSIFLRYPINIRVLSSSEANDFK